MTKIVASIVLVSLVLAGCSPTYTEVECSKLKVVETKECAVSYKVVGCGNVYIFEDGTAHSENADEGTFVSNDGKLCIVRRVEKPSH